MLSHILFGQSQLQHGGLLFRARAAGKRGEQTSLAIAAGGGLAVAVTFTLPNSFQVLGTGAGDIAVTVAGDTTEAEVIAALQASAEFNVLASVEQASGDGTDVVAVQAKAQFPAATDGLQQALAAATGITDWESRTLASAGAAVGDIWDAEGNILRINPDSDIIYWEGKLLIGIGFQQDQRYQVQNATLDCFRRGMVLALNAFDHQDLNDLMDIGYGKTNTMKDEASGTPDDRGRLNVIVQSKIRWQESATDEVSGGVPFDHAQIGLFREPYEGDVKIVGDGEVKDQDLVITAQ